ncbi:hypothetical protein DDZ16_12475 [Marinilabilia rubra]|uniref:Uncharacterized protein n=1 Tax=Marinilabilia rubra TaxID=2162893 RepID=A0A2U2B7M5_9BACT|nr:hypothetical protein DDZ16_12475 [Marinilabilia rubra]
MALNFLKKFQFILTSGHTGKLPQIYIFVNGKQQKKFQDFLLRIRDYLGAAEKVKRAEFTSRPIEGVLKCFGIDPV